MRKLRVLRILCAVTMMLSVTACFLDFTGTSLRWLGWSVRIQLMPALLSFGVVATAILVATFIFGRVYCSFVCPLGIMQDVAIRLVRLAWRRRACPPELPGRGRQIFRIAVAAAFFSGGFLGIHFTWLEPYAIYGRAATLLAPLVRIGSNSFAEWMERHGSYAFHAVEVTMPPLCVAVLSAAMVALVLALALWKGRFWCNTVCPVGTLLGLISRFSLMKPKIDRAKCVSCHLCEKVCKAHCIDVSTGRIDCSSCVACFNCGATCGKGAISWSR